MRWGDYIVMASASLNVLCVIAYALQSHWLNVMYFLGAALINTSIILMWYFK